MAPRSERWPPVYDSDELKQMIAEIAGRPDLRSAFYHLVSEGGPLCQGDVLRFRSPVPAIDEIGEPVALGDIQHWLVIGNTCDFHREEVSWAQVVPIEAISEGLNPQYREDFRSFRLSRRFYIPNWAGSDGDSVLYADFLRPVAIHKKAVRERAEVVARMSRAAWVLLHCCLIRFMARDDGRFDE